MTDKKKKRVYYIRNQKSIHMLGRRLPRTKPFNAIMTGKTPDVIHLNHEHQGGWSPVLTLIINHSNTSLAAKLLILLEKYRRKS
jgi:hypothetical protein